MDYEALNTELKTRLDRAVDRMKASGMTGGGNSQSVTLSNNYKEFKTEIRNAIFSLIDKNDLIFTNAEDSANFLYNLKPTIDECLNRFFSE